VLKILITDGAEGSVAEISNEETLFAKVYLKIAKV